MLARSRKVHEALEAIKPLRAQFRQSVLAAAFRGDLTADWRDQRPGQEPGEALLARVRRQHREHWEVTELARMRQAGRAPKNARWKEKYGPETDIDLTELPDLPETWEYGRADEVVAPGTVITYGIVLPAPNLAEGVPYIRGQDIEGGRVLANQLWRTSPEIAAKHSRSSLLAGGVLLCIIRHLKVATVPPRLDGANLTQCTVRLRPSGIVLGPYLASPQAQAWMKARYFGMAMPRSNGEDARAIPIPVAPLAEQAEVVRLLEKFERYRELVAAQVTDALQAARQLDQSILAKAFRGELVPQNPEDEPAVVLLERIRVERISGNPSHNGSGRCSGSRCGRSADGA